MIYKLSCRDTATFDAWEPPFYVPVLYQFKGTASMHLVHKTQFTALAFHNTFSRLR